MFKFKIIGLMFFAIALQSCNKEKDFDSLYNSNATDTIFPKKLFPVYPGSWWRYLNEKGDTILIETSSTYVLNTLNYGLSIVEQYQTHPEYVPLWNGNPVYGYYIKRDNFINGDSIPMPEFAQAVDDKMGNLYQTSEGNCDRCKEFTSSVINIQTTILINNIVYNNAVKVLDVEKYVKTGTEITKRISYYVPDIGLVSQELINDFYPPNDKKIEMIDYHINH